MSNEIDLLCCVQGSEIDHIFPVRISHSAKTMHLRRAIRQQEPTLRHIDDEALQFWKVAIPLTSITDDSGQFNLEDGQQLMDIMRISDIWERAPSDDILSGIIIRLPDGECVVHAAISSIQSNISLPGDVNDHWSPRSDTVRCLFDTLERRRLVHVRSPLAASVYSMRSWLQNAPQSDQALDARRRSMDPTYPFPGFITFFFVDDGQDSYQDEMLWSKFLERVHDAFYNNYRVILFCSYGNPSPRPVFHKAGVPLCLSFAARVNLWPTDRSIGLLLTRLEFDEVVARHERKLKLHPVILARIFDWTAGHVGAVVQLLHVLGHQEVRQGAQLTVDDFYAENPPHLLGQQLRSKCGPFGRGLPLDGEISEDPNVSVFLRTLLRHGDVKEEMENRQIIHKCNRNGWIYAYESQPSSVTRYALASPLHSSVISWILVPSNMPRYASPFELCFVPAISSFEPSQMHIPIHRVGAPNLVDNQLPEAQ
ncbi:hypothetical protein M413DRAFT_25311 [Hebeloma cylindrosporum]|uniref:Crinkler effector protein N-terminal domain-containing protein n=1 Tax=Hebeloma cylindrosporum TaxID=76867 RepID=A0A0C2Y4V8_HEBCY|nr:hypothetical protein M413DRAFT_25311 [Hebeloma cylindrosporum h7]